LAPLAVSQMVELGSWPIPASFASPTGSLLDDAASPPKLIGSQILSVSRVTHLQYPRGSPFGSFIPGLDKPRFSLR
jgi:hypothetical protein